MWHSTRSLYPDVLIGENMHAECVNSCVLQAQIELLHVRGKSTSLYCHTKIRAHKQDASLDTGPLHLSSRGLTNDPVPVVCSAPHVRPYK